MYSYLAYGLGIHSMLPLPELLVSKAACEIVIQYGCINRISPEPDSEGRRIQATADEVHFYWPGEGSILVRRGSEIILEPTRGVEQSLLRLSIEGPVLGVLLHQRGRLVLHASAVAINERAIAFLGASGWGKSTMAGALHTIGHCLVSDDVLAIQVSENRPLVFPSFPQLKLWPDAADVLGSNPASLPRLRSDLDKRACRADRGFSPEPLQLGQIYVLSE